MGREITVGNTIDSIYGYTFWQSLIRPSNFCRETTVEWRDLDGNMCKCTRMILYKRYN